MKHKLYENSIVKVLQNYRSQLAWRHIGSHFSLLSGALIEMFCAAASSLTIERNHEIGKTASTIQRCRLQDRAYQRHINVSFDALQLKRTLRSV